MKRSQCHFEDFIFHGGDNKLRTQKYVIENAIKFAGTFFPTYLLVEIVYYGAVKYPYR